MTEQDHQSDPHRLQVAVHELGHFVVWRAIPGARVVTVQVTGHGRNTEGTVEVDWSTSEQSPVANRAYLAGLLAGREADAMWAEQTGTRQDTSGCGHDLAVYHRVRRTHPPSGEWSSTEIRGDARRLVRASWAEITRLAPRLAHRGQL
nr:hypothetical protein [Kibdelosporangium sp. MJ126-NF4]CEL23356.1 hypothetical protein [Kibdelosporangium sp. MJ126-NF4]CTQ96908.1 hypothetical protein [Kibdelosporangium sp. MJ126-NF4]